MVKLYVPLRADHFDRLRALARAERRRPQDQAAVLLERALDVEDDELVEPQPEPVAA